MVFTCRQCGTCCMYLGDYIVIEQQTGPFRFACESVSTGTPFTAEIDEDKRGIFLDHTFPDQHPHACRFLRRTGHSSAAPSIATARRSASITGVS